MNNDPNLGGSIRHASSGGFKSLLSPRARSAHVTRTRFASKHSHQQRVESSQGAQPRDFSAKPRPTAGGEASASDAEADMITLHGKQVKMHQPLQNHDNDYLSNFITQMYHTTTTNYQKPHPIIEEVQPEIEGGASL